MNSIPQMARAVEKFTTDNSPTVLTAIGAAGVVTTGVLAFKGGMRANQILMEERSRVLSVGGMQDEEAVEPSLEKKIKLTWACYIPAVSSGILTVGAVIGASQISSRRAAAVAAAYSLSEKRLDEYRGKISEKFGGKKVTEAETELKQENFQKNYTPDKQIVIISGKVLCYDEWSNRYFQSTMEDLKSAVNRVNHQILNDNYASLSDYYDAIGLERTGGSDEFGWNVDKLLEPEFTTVLSEQQEPAISIALRVEPIRDYFRLRA